MVWISFCPSSAHTTVLCPRQTALALVDFAANCKQMHQALSVYVCVCVCVHNQTVVLVCRMLSLLGRN